MKINKIYLDEAIRIRETYLSIIEQISKKETEINRYKSNIETLMKSNSEYISKNKTKTIDQVKENIKGELDDIDSNINKIVEKLTPLFDEMTKLEKQSKELYKTIKSKYPKLTEEDIQKEVFKVIKK